MPLELDPMVSDESKESDEDHYTALLDTQSSSRKLERGVHTLVQSGDVRMNRFGTLESEFFGCLVNCLL